MDASEADQAVDDAAAAFVSPNSSPPTIQATRSNSATAAKAFEPHFVIVSAVSAEPFATNAVALRRLARRHRLGVGGAGAADVDLDEAVVLTGDPVSEGERLTDLAR